MSSLTNDLRSTKEELLQSAASLTENNIDKVPFEGSWTAGQLLEHVDKAVSPGLLQGKVQASNRAADEKVAQLKNIFLDFNTKMKSPGFIEPTETTHDKSTLMDSLSGKFDELISAAETMKLDEECLDFEVPGMGKFTRYEWISFYMIHTQRHIHQLKKIVSALEG